jgi:hypothetical protein
MILSQIITARIRNMIVEINLILILNKTLIHVDVNKSLLIIHVYAHFYRKKVKNV